MSDSIQVRVSFRNDGAVIAVSPTPELMAPQAWFDHLTRAAGHAYRAYAGGRGVFTLTPEEYDAVKASHAPNGHNLAQAWT
jgi:hypothetical protein